MTDTYQGHDEAASGEAAGTADVAREEAGNVAHTAVDAGRNVAGTAKDEAANVVGEAKAQVSSLLTQVTGELRDQAATQQTRAADGLRTVSGDLDDMSSASSGIAADLVSQVSTRANSLASWLGDHDPESLLDEVRSYARRRPGTFIAIAAVAGLVVGRITRSAVTNASDSAKPTASPRPVTDSSGVYASSSVNSFTDASAPRADYSAEPVVPSAPATTTPVYSSLAADDLVTEPAASYSEVSESAENSSWVDAAGEDRDASVDEFGAGNAQRPAGDDH